jgi:tetraacyldisaccharide 4'-kinase
MKVDIASIWYQQKLHPIARLLLPLSFLFRGCVWLRRWLYTLGILKKHKVSIPVIVVGNITVGGTGKTPFVIELANWLQAQGYHPGIVSRGVGGKQQRKPRQVQLNDSPEQVGDEAILLVKNTNCPVVIGIDRVAAVQSLQLFTTCDVIISDDGLQHYRLHRNIEIAVVDGVRQLGNTHLLPAGPLREPFTRLHTVDWVVVNDPHMQNQCAFTLEPVELVSVLNPHKTMSMQMGAQEKIHAVAGIGHPQRFFNTLKQAGFSIIPHAFPDHHLYQKNELKFSDSFNIVMTEKDAVKCTGFANEKHWYLKVTAKISESLREAILMRLKHCTEKGL